MNNTKPRKNIVYAQVALLVKAMEGNHVLASGRGNSLQGRAEIDAEWVRLAELLNSVGGPIKTVDKWKQVSTTYNNYKHTY